MSLTRQLSLFGVEAAAPAPGDLAGLLAAPGQVVRMGGTARVSVVVEDRWRAAILVAEMRLRGLPATCVSTVDEHIGVRTAYSAVLAPLASAWLRGAIKLPPAGFALKGRRLRLWMAAAGYHRLAERRRSEWVGPMSRQPFSCAVSWGPSDCRARRAVAWTGRIGPGVAHNRSSPAGATRRNDR